MTVLLVTNDYPPKVGGIQSYLRDFVSCLVAARGPQAVIVLCSTQDARAAAEWDAQQPYRIVRMKQAVLLPTPDVRAEMVRLIQTEKIETVWFGAAAPLGLLAAAAKSAGAQKVVATTHGHEVGWAMLPGTKQALRAIGDHADVVTYIADYTKNRFEAAFGPHPTWEHLPSGVEVSRFQVLTAAQKTKVKQELAIKFPELDAQKNWVVCVSRLVPRKGQDTLIKAWPAIRGIHPDTQLVIVGEGRYDKKLRGMAKTAGVGIVFTGRVSEELMVKLVETASVFAMPCRTRGGGLDVEGLGIVFLEAQAAGIPVVVGDSGGAKETITPETGVLIPGDQVGAVADAVNRLLVDPALCEQMGKAGRAHVENNWTWELLGRRAEKILFE